MDQHLQGRLDEIYRLRQSLASAEEKMAYLSYERAKEIWVRTSGGRAFKEVAREKDVGVREAKSDNGCKRRRDGPVAPGAASAPAASRLSARAARRAPALTRQSWTGALGSAVLILGGASGPPGGGVLVSHGSFFWCGELPLGGF